MMFDPVPGCTAFGFLLALQFLNLFALFLVLNRFFGVSLPFRWSVPNFVFGIALLAIPQYFVLLHRKKFRQIVQTFAHESERQSLVGGLMVGIYVVFSVILFFWAASLFPQTL